MPGSTQALRYGHDALAYVESLATSLALPFTAPQAEFIEVATNSFQVRVLERRLALLESLGAGVGRTWLDAAASAALCEQSVPRRGVVSPGQAGRSAAAGRALAGAGTGYCSHKAFRFRSVACARVFLWSNPLVMREEVYALPHRVHHRCADRPGDPYGPHMGWLGAFLAQDSTFRINRALGAADYRRYRESMRHVGMVSNDHARFLRTGSIEAVAWYAARHTSTPGRNSRQPFVVARGPDRAPVG